MVTAKNKQMQALAMIDGAVVKRMLADQLWEEAEKEMAQARAVLDELADEAAWSACDPEVEI